MLTFLFVLVLFGNGPVTQLSSYEFYNLLNSNSDVLLLDVRIQEDYNSGYIERAKWAGTEMVLDSILTSYSKDILILIYCDYGQRTKTVIKLLEKKGFKHIKELEGGLNLWLEHSFPLVESKLTEESDQE
jgi:rhodanese-related sulfurtransferase